MNEELTQEEKSQIVRNFNDFVVKKIEESGYAYTVGTLEGIIYNLIKDNSRVAKVIKKRITE